MTDSERIAALERAMGELLELLYLLPFSGETRGKIGEIALSIKSTRIPEVA